MASRTHRRRGRTRRCAGNRRYRRVVPRTGVTGALGPDTAVPEITRLAAAGDPVGAYRLAQRALAAARGDAQVAAAWAGTANAITVASEPSGATVEIRALSGKDEGWVVLGTTPLETRLPLGQIRWRFSKDGYETREIVPNPYPMNVVLVPSGTSPPGMVSVPSSDFELERSLTTMKLPAFWIDTYEVTNRDYKTFADSGGYQKREYWTQPIVNAGKTLSWTDALALFRDRTGRPGPSTWELGSYPDGQEDWPVSGVSWYEAAAYATFAGKTLPTVYEWRVAAGTDGVFSDVLQFSNFGGPGPALVGASGSLGPYGTHDMAGNVKEWVWNESSEGKRFILGGAWFEARLPVPGRGRPLAASPPARASDSAACARARRCRRPSRHVDSLRS